MPLRRIARVETETFELQVSTPFQLAWAVMEHDLIYKPDGRAPTFAQQRAVHAAAALAYAADQFFELAHSPSPPAVAGNASMNRIGVNSKRRGAQGPRQPRGR